MDKEHELLMNNQEDHTIICSKLFFCGAEDKNREMDSLTASAPVHE